MTGRKIRPILIIICVAAVLAAAAVGIMVATRGSISGFFASLTKPAETEEQSEPGTDSPNSSATDTPSSKVSSVPGQPSTESPASPIETTADETEPGAESETADATSDAASDTTDVESSETAGTTGGQETSSAIESELTTHVTDPAESSAEATSTEATTSSETQTEATTPPVTLPSTPETTVPNTGASTTAPEPPQTQPEPVTCEAPVTTSSPEETTSEGPWRPDPATTIPVPTLSNGQELPDVLIAPNGDEVPGVWVRSGDRIWFTATLPFELGMFESGKWWAFHEYYHVLEYGTYTRVGTTYVGFRADNPLPIYQGEGSVVVIDVSDTVEPGSWW